MFLLALVFGEIRDPLHSGDYQAIMEMHTEDDMANSLWKRFRETGLFDAEMFKKGWWMLLLILGTIAILFAICCILVFSYPKT